MGRRSAASELAPTGDMALRRDRIHAFCRGGGRGVKLLNRRNDFAPMADDGDAQVLEVVKRQFRQHRAVDFVVAERRLILPKAEPPQPNPDIHRCFLRPAELDDDLMEPKCPWRWSGAAALGRFDPFATPSGN